MNRVVSFLLVCLFLSSTAYCATLPGWSVTILDPSASTYSMSYGDGVYRGRVVGRVNTPSTGGYFHACLWDGSSSSLTDLSKNASRPTQSNACAISGDQQVGLVAKDYYTEHAALWTGDASSYIDLNPEGSSRSQAFGVDNGRQVGYVSMGSITLAALWSGTASSWVNLTPTGYSSAAAYDIYDNHQVGYAVTGNNTHAGIWANTSSSWLDIHPSCYTASRAVSIDGSQQVGYALTGGKKHAGLWNGTSSSWVDLNPTGSRASYATSVCGGIQVGSAFGSNGPGRASLWKGTSASWMDLGSLLPSQYCYSEANSIDILGDEIWIAGTGYTSGDSPVAVMWHYSPVPEPSGVVVLICGFAVVLCFILSPRVSLKSSSIS